MSMVVYDVPIKYYVSIVDRRVQIDLDLLLRHPVVLFFFLGFRFSFFLLRS